MRKWVSCMLAVAILVSLLSIGAAAADRTVYLSGYSDHDGVVEVDADKSEISIQGNLQDYGTVVYSDFGEDMRDFSVPVYYSKDPVTVTITGGIDKGEAVSGQDENGSWSKIPLSSATVNAMTYDSATKVYTVSQENAVYFDGTFAISDDNGDPSDTTVTIQEKVEKEQKDEWLDGWCYNGATASLSEPGIYLVSVYLRGLEGTCDVFIWIGEENISTPASVFTDVAPDAYYVEAISWAVENEITTGTSETTFSPNSTCTRAQILTFLWRAYGCPAPTSSDAFEDIADDAYYADAAHWALDRGLISGGQFEGNTPCTRIQTVIYLWELAGKPTVTSKVKFTDVPSDGDEAMAVAWAVEQNITSGTSATTFTPDNTCTRGQIVTFLYRSLVQ